MAERSAPTIALFAKYPIAGAAKTRLIPELGADGAAQVHRLLVERTIATIREAGLPFAVWYTGASRADFEEWLGGDVDLIEQSDGDLGARLASVPAPAIVLGADIPDLTAHHLRQAAEGLAAGEIVIGPAMDGGYYLLGYNSPVPFLFADMAWGTDTVFEETVARLDKRGLGALMLKPLNDCDRPEDLARFPDLLP